MKAFAALLFTIGILSAGCGQKSETIVPPTTTKDSQVNSSPIAKVKVAQTGAIFLN
ncbi:MAG: hypothetical protein QOF61_3302, partial [Acidobacteriota bacterium]|nr:hypothetical protein [Acidobacteriota bacterium]